MSWTHLEHSVWKLLKTNGLDLKESFFLAVSGGIDSMVLLHLLHRLKPKAELMIAYFHHGPDNSEQIHYRNSCLDLVKKTCLLYNSPNIEFIEGRSSVHLDSEGKLRQARWDFFLKHQKPNQPLLTAHHLDDWVETLTLKLIRGVGREGFTAFKIWDGHIFRPFLETKKSILVEYARENQIKWIDDPSNDSNQYLRNWLRNEWFKILDEKNPSGYENYSRSLLRLCQDLEQNQTFELCFYGNNPKQGLDRTWFYSLNEKYQLKALSLFLRHHSILNTTQGQIAEIQKRLDKNQKDITFSIGSIKWFINVNQIMLEF